MAKNETKNKRKFWKDFKAELKRVIWPTPKQLFNNTLAVVVICVITAVIVAVLDLAFEGINKQGVNKIKEVVTSSNSTSEQNTTSGSGTEETTDGETAIENGEEDSEEDSEGENEEQTETTDAGTDTENNN